MRRASSLVLTAVHWSTTSRWILIDSKSYRLPYMGSKSGDYYRKDVLDLSLFVGINHDPDSMW